MGSIRIPQKLRAFARHFDDAGYECFLVGGAVRNMLIDLPSGDYDVATNARPEDVIRLFSRVIPTGIRHGTVTVLYRGEQIEVTTYRTESSYGDQRRPDEVQYVGSIIEDLRRRDFTMNAIAIDCVNGTVVDPNDGAGDIRRRRIHAIGDPGLRFAEDGLRLVRACRFAAQLEFEIDTETVEGIRTNTASLRGVSPERVRDELFKMLGAGRPSIGFAAMSDTGLLEKILPELASCRGVEQKGLHRHDVYIHSVLACDAASPENLEIRAAALFHDIGKPISKSIDAEGITTFHRHEEHSERLARIILKRLKCSKAFEDSVCHVIRHHMFHYEPDWTDAAVRRFIHRVTPEYIDRLFALRRADTAAISGRSPLEIAQFGSLNEFESRINSTLAESQALTIRDLAIDGNILSTEGGIPKNREMGVVLEFLLESVLDDPHLNDRNRLLAIATRFYEDRLRGQTR